ncbi:MAG: hypothetical protein KDA29_00440 [Phycisphaerales bacterium]|nr:hypothetical protein [Phycisphaerales bacterium]
MRLISRKLWRAYPQLDRYSDEVCKRYMRHAFHRRNLWKGVLLLITTVIVAIVVAAVSIHFFGYEVQAYSGSRRGSVSIMFGLMIVGAFLTSVLWFPVVSCFIVRDFWLRHVIQKQLQSTNCSGCDYQLLGLTIEREEQSAFVTCPECGNRVELNTGHIMEGDVDPHILRCS